MHVFPSFFVYIFFIVKVCFQTLKIHFINEISNRKFLKRKMESNTIPTKRSKFQFYKGRRKKRPKSKKLKQVTTTAPITKIEPIFDPKDKAVSATASNSDSISKSVPTEKSFSIQPTKEKLSPPKKKFRGQSCQSANQKENHLIQSSVQYFFSNILNVRNDDYESDTEVSSDYRSVDSETDHSCDLQINNASHNETAKSEPDQPSSNPTSILETISNFFESGANHQVKQDCDKLHCYQQLSNETFYRVLDFVHSFFKINLDKVQLNESVKKICFEVDLHQAFSPEDSILFPTKTFESSSSQTDQVVKVDAKVQTSGLKIANSWTQTRPKTNNNNKAVQTRKLKKSKSVASSTRDSCNQTEGSPSQELLTDLCSAVYEENFEKSDLQKTTIKLPSLENLFTSVQRSTESINTQANSIPRCQQGTTGATASSFVFANPMSRPQPLYKSFIRKPVPTSGPSTLPIRRRPPPLPHAAPFWANFVSRNIATSTQSQPTQSYVTNLPANTCHSTTVTYSTATRAENHSFNQILPSAIPSHTQLQPCCAEYFPNPPIQRARYPSVIQTSSSQFIPRTPGIIRHTNQDVRNFPPPITRPPPFNPDAFRFPGISNQSNETHTYTSRLMVFEDRFNVRINRVLNPTAANTVPPYVQPVNRPTIIQQPRIKLEPED